MARPDLEKLRGGVSHAYLEKVQSRMRELIGNHVEPDRILQEAAAQEQAATDSPSRGFDPYSTDIGAVNGPARPRRTLDDMRRLSEVILRNRLRAK